MHMYWLEDCSTALVYLAHSHKKTVSRLILAVIIPKIIPSVTFAESVIMHNTYHFQIIDLISCNIEYARLYVVCKRMEYTSEVLV